MGPCTCKPEKGKNMCYHGADFFSMRSQVLLVSVRNQADVNCWVYYQEFVSGKRLEVNR